VSNSGLGCGGDEDFATRREPTGGLGASDAPPNRHDERTTSRVHHVTGSHLGTEMLMQSLNAFAATSLIGTAALSIT
jgi:hypothetical protein